MHNQYTLPDNFESDLFFSTICMNLILLMPFFSVLIQNYLVQRNAPFYKKLSVALMFPALTVPVIFYYPPISFLLTSLIMIVFIFSLVFMYIKKIYKESSERSQFLVLFALHVTLFMTAILFARNGFILNFMRFIVIGSFFTPTIIWLYNTFTLIVYSRKNEKIGNFAQSFFSSIFLSYFIFSFIHMIFCCYVFFNRTTY